MTLLNGACLVVRFCSPTLPLLPVLTTCTGVRPRPRQRGACGGPHLQRGCTQPLLRRTRRSCALRDCAYRRCGRGAGCWAGKLPPYLQQWLHTRLKFWIPPHAHFPPHHALVTPCVAACPLLQTTRLQPRTACACSQHKPAWALCWASAAPRSASCGRRRAPPSRCCRPSRCRPPLAAALGAARTATQVRGEEGRRAAGWPGNSCSSAAGRGVLHRTHGCRTCSGTSLLLLLFHAPSFCTHRLAAEMGSISSGMSTGGRSSLGGSEEVIQIEGTVQQCVAALRGVATLLRGWQIRRVMTMQQGAMAMQQGGYGPGFGPPPMPMAQQVPMSPTSTSGAPMSPTSPGAPVAVAVAGPAFWVSSACGYRWQEAICAPDCKPSCLRLQIHVPPLSCPCRHPATQHAAEPGADRGLHPHGCQHAAAWHAAAQRRPAEAHLQLHVPPEQYPGGSLGAVPLCHGARCGG